MSPATDQGENALAQRQSAGLALTVSTLLGGNRMSEDAEAVAAAAVQLVGTLSGYEAAANTLALAHAVSKTTRRTRARLRGQITQLFKHRYSNLKRHDREAVFTGAVQIINSAKFDENLARTINNDGALLEHLLSPAHHETAPVRNDPVTGPCFEQVLKLVAQFVTAEVRTRTDLVPARVEQAESDISRLRVESQRHGEHLSGLAAAVETTRARLDDFPMPTSPGAGFVGAASLRSLPRVFANRVEELEAVTCVVASHGGGLISGPQLTGRFELSRQWALRHRSKDHLWAIQYQDIPQFSRAAADLAARYDVAPSADLISCLTRLLQEHPDLTLIVADLDRHDVVNALVEAHPPGCGVLLLTIGTDFYPVSPQNISISPLNSSHIEEILAAEMGSIPDVDLTSMAALLTGQPLAARQAASFISASKTAAVDYLELLRREPAVILRRPIALSDLASATAAVWDTNLDLTTRTSELRAEGVLSALHLMQGAAYEAHWAAASSLWHTGQDEFNVVTPKFHLASDMLQRLGLVHLENDVVTAPPLLLAYTWSKLQADEQRKVAEACLHLALTAARAGVSVLSVGALSAASWVSVINVADIRALCPELLDETIHVLANAYRSMDLLEHAHALLWRLLEVQQGEKGASRWRTAISLGNILLNLDAKEGVPYVSHLLEEDEETGDLPATHQAELWTLAAAAYWQSGDLARSVEACTKGIRNLESLTGHDRIIGTANLSRHLGWAQIDLGEIAPGLESLEWGLNALREDPAFSWAAEEYRSHTQEFLRKRNIPQWRKWAELGSLHTSNPLPGDATLDYTWAGSSASASAALGDFKSAEEYIRADEAVLVHPYYDAINIARRAVRLSAVHIDSQGKSGGFTTEDIEDLLRDALSRIDKLPLPLRSTVRVLGMRNAIWVQLGLILMESKRDKEAIDLLLQAAESDAEVYGVDHREYADDALVLGQVLGASGRIAEARAWFQKAAKVYGTPGPHANGERLAMLRSLGFEGVGPRGTPTVRQGD